MVKELIKSIKELEDLAAALAAETHSTSETIVSRYTKIVTEGASFISGKKTGDQTYQQVSVNKEWMAGRIYAREGFDDLFPHNLSEVSLALDLRKERFQLPRKGLKLPQNQGLYFMEVPSSIGLYDQELTEFTRTHPNTRITREMSVEQKIIVNSQGGIAIQSIPSFAISYSHGYEPLPTFRVLTAVCSSEEDIKNFKNLIAFMPDPTLERRVKNATSFSEAFHQLYNLSGLKYGSLEEAGLPNTSLHDVVVLTGVPAHEVFGHHFEEPSNFLDFTEIATFKKDQEIRNKDIILVDSPNLTVAGLKLLGFTIVDAYGRKREPRVHVRDGKCVGFLGGEYADLENLQRHLNFRDIEENLYVGNSSQHIDAHFPQPRMSCTILDGKTEDLDLEGKLVIVPHAGHTRAQDKTYVLDAKECYVIKNGIPQRVNPIKVTGE